MNIPQRLTVPGPDLSPIFGFRYHDGTDEWELVAQNDLHVPFWSRVVDGKMQAKQFTVHNGEAIAQKALYLALHRQLTSLPSESDTAESIRSVMDSIWKQLAPEQVAEIDAELR